MSASGLLQLPAELVLYVLCPVLDPASTTSLAFANAHFYAILKSKIIPPLQYSIISAQKGFSTMVLLLRDQLKLELDVRVVVEAVANNWTDLALALLQGVTVSSFTKKANNTKFIKINHPMQRYLVDANSIAYAAGRSGSHEMLSLLERKTPFGPSLKNARNPSKCSSLVLYGAAFSGDSLFFRKAFLEASITEQETINCAVSAFLGGRTDVLDFLRKSLLPMTSKIEYFSEFAAINGHMNALEWIRKNFAAPFPFRAAIRMAIVAGQNGLFSQLLRSNECAEWRTPESSYRFTELLDDAIKVDNRFAFEALFAVEEVSSLFQRRKPVDLMRAIENKSIGVVKYILQNTEVKLTEECWCQAVRYVSLPLLKFLLSNKDHWASVSLSRIINFAIELRKKNVIQLLLEAFGSIFDENTLGASFAMGLDPAYLDFVVSLGPPLTRSAYLLLPQSLAPQDLQKAVSLLRDKYKIELNMDVMKWACSHGATHAVLSALKEVLAAPLPPSIYYFRATWKNHMAIEWLMQVGPKFDLKELLKEPNGMELRESYEARELDFFRSPFFLFLFCLIEFRLLDYA